MSWDTKQEAILKQINTDISLMEEYHKELFGEEICNLMLEPKNWVNHLYYFYLEKPLSEKNISILAEVHIDLDEDRLMDIQYSYSFEAETTPIGLQEVF